MFYYLLDHLDHAMLFAKGSTNTLMPWSKDLSTILLNVDVAPTVALAGVTYRLVVGAYHESAQIATGNARPRGEAPIHAVRLAKHWA